MESDATRVYTVLHKEYYILKLTNKTHFNVKVQKKFVFHY